MIPDDPWTFFDCRQSSQRDIQVTCWITTFWVMQVILMRRSTLTPHIDGHMHVLTVPLFFLKFQRPKATPMGYRNA